MRVISSFLYSRSYGYPVITLSALLLFSLTSHAQTSSENYVLSRTYKTHYGKVRSTADNSKYWGDASQVQTQVSYFDGLGKEKQTVAVFGAPDMRDLVTKTVYDKMNRPVRNYLPIALTSRNGKLQTDSSTYYNSANVDSPTTKAWTETIYDGSPLSRIKEQKAPGVSTGVLKAYKVVTDNEIKRYWINSSNLLEQTAYYASGQLSYVETLDEDGKKIEEFTDHNGRLVAKRLAGDMVTYYVYDAKAQLRYVLQPAYQDASGNQSDKLNLFAFQYSYDEKGHMIAKRIPGQGATITMEYNNNDLLAFMTDAKGQKFYYLYDEMNRQKEMGMVIGTENKALLKSHYNTYTDVISSYAYEDEWGIADSTHYFVGNPTLENKKGLLTWSETRVLNADGNFNSNDSWLVHVYYYDRKGRLIQTFNQLYNVGTDAFEKRSYKLDFAGNIIQERITQNTSGGNYQLDKSNTYDHQNRLKIIAQKFYHNGVEKKSYRHVANSYNEVGRLSGKEYHNALQKQTLRYTPRSWMASTVNDGGKTFALRLRYYDNGNIDSLSWQTHSSSGSFPTINYDAANRLIDATGGTLEEYGITYDKNGNLKTLKRKKNGANIDNLSYSEYTGNLLRTVTDGENDVEGFDNGSSGTNQDYSYDHNGNLTMDLNKKISVINYNVLNLPREVTLTDPGRSIYYQYDASGRKLQTVNPNGTTVYAGAFEYNSSGILQRIALEEGQLVKNGDVYDINYYMKDHLGNVRMVLKDDGTVLQETEYYPFGLPINRNGTDLQNKHLYNGKEKQPETGYLDYGARMYMPEIGRWGGVDPLGEMDPGLTGYRYGFNNPIRFTDFMGLWETNKNGNYTTDNRDDIERFMTFMQAQSANGNNTTTGEMNRFISFENSGGGDSYRLRGGSTLLFDGPTVKGNIQNGNWKTSSIEWPGLYPNQDYFDKWGIGSTYAGLSKDVLEAINTAPEGMWYGTNGKLYSQSWGGNQHTGSRTVSMAQSAKALKAVKMLGKGLLVADVMMNLGELDYNGYSNRGLAKIGVAAAIYGAAGLATVLTGGLGGVAIGFALGAIEAHGGFDSLYNQFSNDPRFSISNPNLQR